MGGCCCHSTRRTESHESPIYYHCPEDFEENEPLSSSTHDPPAAVPVLPLDIVHTSIPDSCQETNAPSPLEDSVHAQSNTGGVENFVKNEHRQPTDTVSMGDVRRDSFESSDNCDDLKESEQKGVSESVSNSPKIKEKLSNLENSIVLVTDDDDDDVCPTCLEEYDAENPRITTKCKHHFHLSCIIEWFERSNTCAICDKIMEVDNMSLFDQTL